MGCGCQKVAIGGALPRARTFYIDPSGVREVTGIVLPAAAPTTVGARTKQTIRNFVGQLPDITKAPGALWGVGLLGGILVAMGIAARKQT